jgi:hypothetical protein
MSILITTNKPFAERGEVFPNATTVVAIVDRLVHHSEIVTIEGDSYRLKPKGIPGTRKAAHPDAVRRRKTVTRSQYVAAALRLYLAATALRMGEAIEPDAMPVQIGGNATVGAVGTCASGSPLCEPAPPPSTPPATASTPWPTTAASRMDSPTTSSTPVTSATSATPSTNSCVLFRSLANRGYTAEMPRLPASR